jgi:hypothetical protein
VGLLMGYGYGWGVIEDVVLPPAGLGLIVGILSHSLLGALINTVIVIISYVGLVLIFAMAGNWGSGEPFVFEYYHELIAHAFVVSTYPLFTWFPAMMIGLVIRFFLLKLQKRFG